MNDSGKGPSVPNLSWRQWLVSGVGVFAVVGILFRAVFPAEDLGENANQIVQTEDAGDEAYSQNAAVLTEEQLPRQQECESRWLEAERAGIVLGSRSAGGVPQVVVDEDAFLGVDYATKVGFAQTLNCAAFGDGRTFAAIEFLSNRTNRQLARWSVGRGLVVE